MIEIKDLLLKFDHLLLSEEIKINSIRKIIHQVVGIEIKKEDIKIKGNTIYLNIKPLYKNEIFIHKKEISDLLKNSLREDKDIF